MKYISVTQTTLQPENGSFDDIIEKLLTELNTWRHSNRAARIVHFNDPRFAETLHVTIVVDRG